MINFAVNDYILALDPSYKCTEQQRNSQAEEVFHKIMDGCVWINIHYLPNKTKVLEIRNFNGYGMRWNYFGEFRGLVEPEDKTL